MSQTRIAETIKNEQRVTVNRTTSPLLAKSVETGRLPGGQNLGRMLLLLAPSADQEQAAAQLVNDLHDPSSASYHQWLTPADFGPAFWRSRRRRHPGPAMAAEPWPDGCMKSRKAGASSSSAARCPKLKRLRDGECMPTSSATMARKPPSSPIRPTFRFPPRSNPVVKGVVRLHSDPPHLTSGDGRQGALQPAAQDNSPSQPETTSWRPRISRKFTMSSRSYDAGINGTGQSIAIVGRSQIDVQNRARLPHYPGPARERSGNYLERRRSGPNAAGHARGPCWM